MNRLAILALLLSPLPASACNDSLLAEAEAAFARGVEQRSDAVTAKASFRLAANRYDELWRRGHHSPALALNRARAHQLAGDLPGAIAAYHEGLTIARFDYSLQRGLEAARTAVAYPHDGALADECKPSTFTTIRTRLSPLEAFAIAASLWLSSCLLVVRWRMTRRLNLLFAASLGLLALLTLGLSWWQAGERLHVEGARPLVIVRELSFLHRGNADAYPVRFEQKLPCGVEARALTERGGWVQVELAGGAVGWFPRHAVIVLDERGPV